MLLLIVINSVINNWLFLLIANVNRSIVNEDMNAALEPKAKKSKANRSSGLTASIGECSSNIDARNKSEAGEDCEVGLIVSTNLAPHD